MDEGIKIGNIVASRYEPKTVLIVSSSDDLIEAKTKMGYVADILSVPLELYSSREAVGVYPLIVDVELNAPREDLKYADVLDVDFNNKYREELMKSAHRINQPIILSRTFNYTPSENEMKKMMEEMISKFNVAGYKLSAFANSTEDMIKQLYALTDMVDTHPDKNIIMVSNGEAGLASKIIFPMNGSVLTYISNKDIISKSLHETLDFLKDAIPVVEDIRKAGYIPKGILEALA